MAETRFVIHKHTQEGQTHWDLMIEWGERLKTWRLDNPPEKLAAEKTKTTSIFDHDKKFLTYQGPVNNGKGTVKIVDEGTIELTNDEITFKGKILNGKFHVVREQNNDWYLISAMHSSEDLRLFRFYDCILYSADILDNQYNELNSMITKMTPSDTEMILRALSISWSIVDSIYRIRDVAQNIPGLNGKTPELLEFLNNTRIVEDFRHYIQHLRRELAKTNLDNFPVWGSFSWIDEKNQKIHTVLTGTVIGKIGGSSCAYDFHNNKLVSKTSLSIKGFLFNIDPCYESTKKFCQFILAWIKNIKTGQFNEKKEILVISAQLIFPDKSNLQIKLGDTV